MNLNDLEDFYKNLDGSVLAKLNPHQKIIIDFDGIRLVSDEIFIPKKELKGEK